MAYEIGTATGHNDLLAKLHAFVTSAVTMGAGQEWVAERYDTATDNHELILRGPGLAGTDNIYVGIRTYEDSGLDYFNWAMRGFIGYVPGDAFSLQPGASNEKAILLWNQPMNYWLVADGQHITLVVKVSTVFQVLFLGLPKPYATPGQYPYPLLIGGMYNGAPAKRWSNNDNEHVMFLKGSNLALRFVNGTWLESLSSYPYSQGIASAMRESFSGEYPILPIVFTDDTPNEYVELQDLFFIPGFANAAENTFIESTKNYVVFQDAFRTDDDSYFALRLD